MKKLLPALLLCAPLLAAQPARFEFDPARTTVEWTLGATMHTVHGTFALKRGAIQLDTSTGAASGELAIDATTGVSGNDSRDRRMHKDVLESGRYPLIVFRPDRMEGTLTAPGNSQVRLHGMLSIHGADHEMTVPVEVHASNGEYTATARFSAPYIAWGMKNPSTLLLRVSDKVEIAIRSVLRTAPKTALR